VQPEQGSGGGGDQFDVEAAANRRGDRPQQRIEWTVGEAVGVASPDRREPGIEAGRRDARPVDDQVFRQCPTQSPGQGCGQLLGGVGVEVEVSHLPAGVDAGVRAAGTDEGDRLVEPQGAGDPGLEFVLDGAQAVLRRPAMEAGSVVADVQPEPGHADGPGRRWYSRSRTVRPAAWARSSKRVTGRSPGRGAQPSYALASAGSASSTSRICSA